MTDVPAESCATCKYSRPAREKHDHVVCCIRPPRVVPTKDNIPASVSERWPLCWADEWCGEYRREDQGI